MAAAVTRTLRRVTVVLAPIIISASVAQLAFASTWTLGLAGGSAAIAQSLQISAPSNVTSSCPAPATSKAVRVSWTAISHATFNIFQSTTSSTSGFSLVATGVTGSSWTSGQLASATYWYQVSASFSSAWTSARSVSTASRKISNTSPLCS